RRVLVAHRRVSDPPEHLLHRRRRSRCLTLEQMEVGLDHGGRVAQLVRDEAEEVALDPARSLGVVTRDTRGVECGLEVALPRGDLFGQGCKSRSWLASACCRTSRARFIVTRLATRARSSSAENGFVT